MAHVSKTFSVTIWQLMAAREHEVAIKVFRTIAEHFPQLVCEIGETSDDPIEAWLEFPQQHGLAFAVNLTLQGDELHLNAGAFWVEWFPCTEPEVIDRYMRAVIGLIAGDYRIREHHRAGQPVKAELQLYENGRWRSFAVWSTLHLPLPWRKTYVVLQNV